VEAVPIRVPNGGGVVTFRVYEEDGIICELHVTAKVKEPLRQWMQTMRTELRKIEAHAKAAGCDEVRIAGRRWGRVFPDYEPYEGPKNGLRKVL
jgi:hypothetical protein